MKTKILSFITMAIVAITITIGVISCTQKPACETDNYGTLKVINNTTIDLWVDATVQGSNYTDEVMLCPEHMQNMN